MTNSRFKPFSECPTNGVFLVWAPDYKCRITGDIRKPYLSGNYALMNRNLNRNGHQIDWLDGKMSFDTRKPVLFADMMGDFDNEIPLEYTTLVGEEK